MVRLSREVWGNEIDAQPVDREDLLRAVAVCFDP